MKGALLFVLSSYSLMLISCGDHNLHRELEVFTEKEVVVPVELRQMVDGRDSLVLNSGDRSARLIVWVDSVACSSCRINQMFQYTEMIDFRKESGDGFVPLFVFSPPRAKIDDVKLTLKHSGLQFPLFIDERGLFAAANPHIPTDSRFHTFLLDKNGKVVLVGDPVNNPPLWELYKTTITQLIENDGTLPISEK